MSRTITLKGQTFETHLTDAEAIATLQRLGTSDFARSLCSQHSRRGSLSPRQWPWVHKLVHDAVNPAPEPDPQAVLQLPETARRLAQAGESLKWPKVRIPGHPDGIRLGLAGPRSRFPGSVNVTTDGSYRGRGWFGRIYPDGRFEPSRSCPPEIEAALQAFEDDPVAVAQAWAKLRGRCCFCSLELTDQRSTDVGYGPVCAGHYGLPWG